MIPYSANPIETYNTDTGTIKSFVSNDSNIDWNTVSSFGDEWSKFDQFSNEEIERIGDDYFDIVELDQFSNAVVLDAGCGSGRWSKYLSGKVKFIEAIDPSSAVFVADKMLHNKNARVTHASIDKIPFPDSSFDMVISLGVLHHIPNTQEALMKCVKKVKKGGICLIYIYYNLDNRGYFFRSLFSITNWIRNRINKLKTKPKKLVCDIIALTVYWPVSRFSQLLYKCGLKGFAKKIPLAYYRNKSLRILRNDSLDRFGTPLEQRFSQKQISRMMELSGLEKIRFSKKEPYWHAIGFKK